jgi:DNA-nicking Smr family endonuclease
MINGLRSKRDSTGLKFSRFYLGSSRDDFIVLKWPLSRKMRDDEPVRIPIDGVLDLHAFRAEEVKTLVPEYLEECRRRGIYQVRIIHGKGTGALRRTVQSLLKRNPDVLSFKTADLGGGGWGATEVVLRK